jgi:glycosyltransferase involved in cell wall biosynthesis
MNILAMFPDGAIVVRYYRADGALLQLRHLDTSINIQYWYGRELWPSILGADVIFLMRLFSKDHIDILQDAIAMNIPTWYDIDDDLFNVNWDSPAYDVYQSKEVRQNIELFLRTCSVVTVSTPHLKTKFDAFRPPNSPCMVIPNGIDNYVFSDVDSYPSTPPINEIIWRGGATHLNDLEDFSSAFIRFANESPPQWSIHFLGHKPVILMRRMSNKCKFTAYDSKFYRYVRMLRYTYRPFSMVIPLAKTPFNLAKSNIAALEGIYAGAVIIVPNLPEWNIFPGALVYSSVEECGDMMLQITQMSEAERKERWLKNMPILQERYLSKMNTRRLNILKQLITMR